MTLTPTVLLAILGGLVLVGFFFQMVFNNGNSDWSEFAAKYPVNTPHEGAWTEGLCNLGAPTDAGNPAKLAMGDSGMYITPNEGKAVYIPFTQVEKAEKLELDEGSKPTCYLTLDGDFKVSLPESFVTSAGDKIVLVSA